MIRLWVFVLFHSLWHILFRGNGRLTIDCTEVEKEMGSKCGQCNKHTQNYVPIILSFHFQSQMINTIGQFLCPSTIHVTFCCHLLSYKSPINLSSLAFWTNGFKTIPAHWPKNAANGDLHWNYHGAETAIIDLRVYTILFSSAY